MNATVRYTEFESRFERSPAVEVSAGGDNVVCGWNDICSRILDSAPGAVVAIETYQGVDVDRLRDEISAVDGAIKVVDTRPLMKPEKAIRSMTFPDVTDDRVFGRMTALNLADFFPPNGTNPLPAGTVVVGPGATLIAPEAGVVVYADMPRWEIQRRQRRGAVEGLGLSDRDDGPTELYKRSHFVDWRVLDRHKKEVLPAADFYLETVRPENPLMIPVSDMMTGLAEIAAKPFELMPFFDPGVWGGHWMEQVCRIDEDAPNQAWCFNCVPEENSLIMRFGEHLFETPSINLVFFFPRELLGDPVRSRFGDEFPIRFDFLDTMGGQNLSFQVHPMTAYIQEHFGVPYTQDESYYIMAAEPDAVVYLGLKDPVDPAAMRADLEAAESGEIRFPAERYVNTWPARKHDHFLIPAGTPHCSGADSMVLEISATPYIFTFKMWDWGRVGLDGKPRPINVDRGIANIQWDRNTEWTGSNLVNRVEPLDSGDGWREERTGLHELEFIETRRYWFDGPVTLDTGGKERGSVHVLNLGEGQSITVESVCDDFEPMLVNYAETFVVPAAVGRYVLKPAGEPRDEESGVVCAWVRF